MRWGAVLIFALAACASPSAAPSPAVPSAPGGTSAPGAPTAAPAKPTAGAAATADSSTGNAYLDDLLKKRSQATFRVSYSWTSTGGNVAAANETWYHKPQKTRVDYSDPASTDRSSQFNIPSGYYVCVTSGGQAVCNQGAGVGEMPETISIAGLVMSSFEVFLMDDSAKSTREVRTIAGQQATCLKSTATTLAALGWIDATLCHASNGVPLFFEWNSTKDKFTMTAVNYTTSVPDSDFDLPAKP